MSDPVHARSGARLAATVLPALAALYGPVVVARAWLYDRGWLAQRQLPRRVLSVGNLTVGGTGKTPIVIWIVERLLAAGMRVAVLSRGYRRRSADPLLLVSDGRRLLVSPTEAGDEPYLIARRCPGAIVAVGADRYALGLWVLDRQPVDCYVLDDGFQHLGLRRDVNLLLVDASDPRGLEALLPAGRLREPLDAIRRASAVLLTRVDSSEDADQIWRMLSQYVPQGSVAPIRVAFRAEKLIEIGGARMKDPSEINGRTAVAFSAIGNVSSFRRLLEQQGVKVVQEFVFRDHHAYARLDMERIIASARQHSAELIVTTEKDAVKLEKLIEPQHQLWALRLLCEIIEGGEHLERLILGR